MDAALTTLREEDIAKHLATAQSLVTRTSVIEAAKSKSKTEIAGTRRRFVQTVSTSGAKSSRSVELASTLTQITPDDSMLSVAQHGVLYKARRAIAVALAVADLYARRTGMDALRDKNASATLQGEEAERFRAMLEASAYVAAFTAAAYVKQMVEASGEPVSDVTPPSFDFSTPQDALKGFVACLEDAAASSADDMVLLTRTREAAEACIEDLLSRKARFSGLAAFENTHLKLDSDGFELNGFDDVPGAKVKPLVMTFKKPNEIIGNHIAKYQAMKLAKMLMAYDFDRQLNPFVELGGFVFTFIGDGAPGTGKTILIQMIAGLINDYCQIAGYPFHYENFGVDQISSYQGKSGQNCKQFINNCLNPRAIGFGTVDDIDQVAAKRSDDRASAGQQEVTAVLMESFAGATTVVRGNCSFGMFSNYPENVDDALRQRAGARWLVDGPITRDDYIDIFVLLAGKNHNIPLGDHDLYEAQVIEKAVSVAYDEHTKPQEEGLLAIYERFKKDHGKLKTMADVGTYLHMIKKAEPRFTGRAIKNITDAIKMRAMDVDLPDEWFEKAETFMHKPYDEKTAMIEELRGPFTLDMVMQEINRYADSEFRYTDKADNAAVQEIIRRERQREKAVDKIKQMKKDGHWGA
ncbi:AAA family ATPase [Salaquimonas pukyongi]|uniref:AAA family ATPase n=1 Tax=Salaquimonas pukyongi TaxID=2712698 RepID=UPI00096BB685|nr:AAA family ATPase [Salaquimonas pukyongi]